MRSSMIWRILQIEVCVMRLIGIIQSLCAFSTRPLLLWKQIQTVMTTSQVFVIYSSLFSVMQAFFQKYHNTLCCPFKILHKHCFQFLLGLTITPREIANNAYAKFWRDDKGTIIVFLKKAYCIQLKIRSLYWNFI